MAYKKKTRVVEEVTPKVEPKPLFWPMFLQKCAALSQSLPKENNIKALYHPDAARPMFNFGPIVVKIYTGPQKVELMDGSFVEI